MWVAMDHQAMDSERGTYGDNQPFLPHGSTSTMQSILFALFQVKDKIYMTLWEQIKD